MKIVIRLHFPNTEPQMDEWIALVRTSLPPEATFNSGESTAYWKLENRTEVTVTASVSGNFERLGSTLATTIADNWETHLSGDSYSAIWHGTGTSRIPSLLWANIEIFYP